jgi:hypothetical protein
MSNQVRKSAPIVKCPYCSHTGSSRGLFTHVRLAHPNINAKPKTATKITVHPYDIKGMGHVKETIHRIETKKKPVKTDWQQEFFIKCVSEVVKHISMQYRLTPINTFERGYKPLGSINGVDENK